MSISTNVSSITANQTFLNNGANNIANTNTDGFVPTQTNIGENGSGDGVKANSRLATDNGSAKSQTDLTKEIPNLITNENVLGVNVASIKTQDQMMGTLLDMKV